MSQRETRTGVSSTCAALCMNPKPISSSPATTEMFRMQANIEAMHPQREIGLRANHRLLGPLTNFRPDSGYFSVVHYRSERHKADVNAEH